MPDSHNVIIVSGPWVGSLTQNEFLSSVFGKTRYDGRAESTDCYQQTILSSHDGDCFLFPDLDFAENDTTFIVSGRSF